MVDLRSIDHFMQKVIFFLLFLSLVIYQFGRINISANISFTILDVIVFIVITSSFFQLINQRKLNEVFLNPIFKPFAVFSVVAFISLLFSPLSLNQEEFFISFLYLLRWIFYNLLFFVLKPSNSNDHQYFEFFLVSSGLALVVIGYIQFLWYPDLRNLYYLGWDDHLWRMFGTFLDPNFFGAFLVLIVLLLFDRVFDSIKRRKKLSIALWSICLFASVIAVVLTYSRTALIMLSLGTLIYFFLKGMQKYSFLFIFIFFSAIIFFSDMSIEGQNLLRTASTQARVESAQHAIQVVSTYPLLGVGFNAYRYAQIDFGFRKASPQIPNHADSGTDNSYLFVLATTGVVGFSGYIFYLYSIMREVWIHKNRKGREVVIASFITVAIGTLFINLLFYPAIILWLMILLNTTQSK